MSDYTIHLKAKAEHDLEEIWDYVDEHNEVAADNLLKKIAGKLEMLKNYPHLGQARPDVFTNIRHLLIDNYSILYEIDDKGKRVVILRVLHSARNLSNMIFH